MTSTNRPTNQQKITAAQLAELGRLITEMGERYAIAADDGRATWGTVQMLRDLRHAAVEIVATDRYVPNGDDSAVRADVLDAAVRRIAARVIEPGRPKVDAEWESEQRWEHRMLHGVDP